MKRVVIDIEYCEQCPYYQLISYDLHKEADMGSNIVYDYKCKESGKHYSGECLGKGILIPDNCQLDDYLKDIE